MRSFDHMRATKVREAELDFIEEQFNKEKDRTYPVETVKQIKSPKVKKESTEEAVKGMFFD